MLALLLWTTNDYMRSCLLFLMYRRTLCVCLASSCSESLLDLHNLESLVFLYFVCICQFIMLSKCLGSCARVKFHT